MLAINSLHDNYSNIVRALELYGNAADAVLCDMAVEKEGLIIFINKAEEIELIGNYKIGRRIATKKSSIKFLNTKILSCKLQKEEMLSNFPRLRSHICEIYSFTTIKLLTPVLGEKIRKFIFEKNKEIEKYFRTNRHYRKIIFNNYPNSENEFDAIAFPLKMIGIKDISFFNKTVAENSSLLENIYSNNLVEDQMIVEDCRAFGSANLWEPDTFTGRKFRNYETGRSVSIYYVNRTDWEKLIGVDLVLYNSEYKSYLFMQYKRMVAENEVSIYRINRQFDEEIRRMKEFQGYTIRNLQTRLNSNPFYFKFCPSKQDPTITADVQLIKGIILPLETLECLYNTGHLTGRNGGKLVSYQNVKQYMDNTLFINLYKNGWIGSSEIDTDFITAHIKKCLKNCHSVILAAM